MEFRSKKGLWLAAFACLSGPVSAADEIRFLTPGASADLETALRAASPLLAAEREDRSDAQDYFAAARAEYAALLAALYARAFYSPVITVSVDGREAASIAPLDAPETIRQITVTVQPGLCFFTDPDRATCRRHETAGRFRHRQTGRNRGDPRCGKGRN